MQWEAYGDPLLSRIDRTIDRAIDTVKRPGSSTTPRSSPPLPALPAPNSPPGPVSLSAPSSSSSASASAGSSTALVPSSSKDKAVTHAEDSRAIYHRYWDHLKEKFVRTRWYSKVDEILAQNPFIQAIQKKASTCLCFLIHV